MVLLDYVIMKLYLQAGADGETHIRVGKLNLVDLAGSERQAKTGATVSQSHQESFRKIIALNVNRCQPVTSNMDSH